MAGTFIVVATDLVAVSVFEVVRKHLQEVEDFDRSLVGERPKWNALIAVIGAHRFPH